MWPDRVLKPGPLTYESGGLPTALRSPATTFVVFCLFPFSTTTNNCFIDRRKNEAFKNKR